MFSKHSFQTGKNKDFSEKWLSPVLRHKLHKVSLRNILNQKLNEVPVLTAAVGLGADRGVLGTWG